MNPRDVGAALVRRLRAEVVADREALAARAAEIDGFLGAWSGPDGAQAAALALVLDLRRR
jgi:hypothetical protein